MADRGLYEASILDMHSIRRHAQHVARTTSRAPVDGMHEFASHTRSHEDNHPEYQLYRTTWEWQEYFVSPDGRLLKVLKVSKEVVDHGQFTEDVTFTDPKPLSERDILDFDYQEYSRALCGLDPLALTP